MPVSQKRVKCDSSITSALIGGRAPAADTGIRRTDAVWARVSCNGACARVPIVARVAAIGARIVDARSDADARPC